MLCIQPPLLNSRPIPSPAGELSYESDAAERLRSELRAMQVKHVGSMDAAYSKRLGTA